MVDGDNHHRGPGMDWEPLGWEWGSDRRWVAWGKFLPEDLFQGDDGKSVAPTFGEPWADGRFQTAIAMLNDSWEIAAIVDYSEAGFPRLTTGRKMVHDLFSLAICIGGIIMIWVSHVNFNSDLPSSDPRRQKQKDMLTGIWMLLAVV